MKTLDFKLRRSLTLLAAGALTALAAGSLRAGEVRSFALGNQIVAAEDITDEAPLLFRAMRFNEATEQWNVDLVVTNQGERSFTQTLFLTIESVSNTTGPLAVDGTTTDSPVRPFLRLDSDGVLAPGKASRSRTIALGFVEGARAPRVQMRVFGVASGRSYALGLTRSLNEVGQPLGNVRVTEHGPLGERLLGTDPDYGVVTLGQSSGEHIWKFERDEYFPVWRRQTLLRGAVRLVPNPRLVRRNTNSSLVAASTTNIVQDPVGNVRLEFSFQQPGDTATVTLTVVDGQTLPGPLPQGWSPLRTFWVESTGTPQAAVVTMKPEGSIAPTETAALVKWNADAVQWQVQARLTGDGTNVVASSLRDWGAYALVIPDSGPLAPPTPVDGQPLLPSTPPLQPAPTFAASGTVTPSSSLASRVAEQVTATASVLVTNSTGLLPSGLSLRTEVTEDYRLQDSSTRFMASYETFITAYRRPAGTTPTALGAMFPMRPLLLFGGDELAEASVRVDVLSPDIFRGGVFDSSGGQLAGERIRVNASGGEFATPQAALLRSLSATNLPLLLIPGQTIAAAFDLTIASVEPERSLSLQVSNIASNRDFILARILSGTGFNGLEPVERLRSDTNGVLTSLEPPTGDRLPGLRGAGQYLLVQVRSPHGLIGGITRNARSQPAAGLPIRVTGQPWLTFSASNGAYRLIAPTGAVQVAGTDLSSGDTDFVDSVVIDPGSPLALDLGTRSRGPRVASVSPMPGSRNVNRVVPVLVTFSQPLNPATIVGDGLRLLGTNGLAVNASLTLNQRGTIATLLAANPLKAGQTFMLLVSSNITDSSGRPLEGATQFSFTTQSDRLDREVAKVTSHEPTNGLSIMIGSVGIAEPESPVILVNETTGQTATVLSKVDGSFSNSIPADVDDFLSAVIQNANGTRNTIPVSRQLFRDGSVALFNGGGILEAESDGGPVQVIVEPGAIENKKRFKVESLGLAELLTILTNVVPSNGRPLPRGLKITSEGQDGTGPIDVAIPVSEAELEQIGVPAGVRPEENVYVLVAPMKQGDETVFMVVDKLEYENGRLVTHSEPFPGANNLLTPPDRVRDAWDQVGLTLHFTPFSGFATASVQALGVIPFVLATKTQPIVFSGKVLEARFDTNGQPVAVRPLPGALVTVSPVGRNLFSATRPGRLNAGTLFCTASLNGSYALMMPHPTIGDPLNPSGGPEEFVLTAQHPSQFGRRLEVLSPGQVSVARLADLIFARLAADAVADPNPPRLIISHSPEFPAPGAQATITVLATHGSDQPVIESVCETVALLNSTNVVDCNLLQILPAINEDVGATGRRSTFPVTCSTNARVVFRVRATVNNAPQAVVLYPIRFTEQEVVVPNPDPSDVNDRLGPRVVWSHPRNDPQGLAPGLSLGEAIQIEFSEAVSRNSLESAIQLTPAEGTPIVELSPDQRFLGLTYFGLRADTTYTLTLNSQIKDIATSANRLDQDPAIPGFDPFVLTFRTAPAISGPLPQMEFGGGAVTRGIYAYALERSGPLDGAVVVYDLSNPASPEKVGALSVPGFPRDIALIPNYSFTRNLDADPIETNDLLAVVGGKVGGGVDEFGNLSAGFQYLWIIKIHRSDPPTLERLASAAVTLSPITAVTKVQWSPPHLAYLESAADAQSINILNLQSFILSSHLPPEDFGSEIDLGRDLNGDGDFVDPGESLPVPSRSREEVAGKVRAFVVFDTNQRILDFDWSSRAGFLGVALGSGRVLDAAGQPTEPVPAAYRTLFAEGLNLTREDASFDYATRSPKRVRTLFDVAVPLTNGQVRVANLALVSVEPTESASARIDVLEVTDPSNPTLLRSIPIPPAHGAVQSIASRDDGMLLAATSNDLLLLDPTKLTLAPNDAGVHPALSGVIRGLGSGARAFGAVLAGLGVVNLGGKHEMRLTSPSLGFIQITTNTFPGLTNIVLSPTNTLHPRDLTNRLGLVEKLLQNAESILALQPAPFRTITNVITSRLSPPNPEAHYYVLIHAPGSAGETIELALEGLNESAHPLRNKRLGFPPVRAMSGQALEAIEQQPIPDFDAPIRTLTAYRLIADKTHPAYNVYLSRPFALTCESMTLADLEGLREELDREILWSGHFLRAYLDYSLAPGQNGFGGNPVLGPFAGRHDPGQGVILPGAMAVAACLPADYIMGPNPPSPVGYATAPGSMASVSLSNGEVRTETVDFALPSRRMPIVFKRTMGSQDLFDGPFGRGWDFNYNQRIVSLELGVFPPDGICPLVIRGNNQDEIGALRDVLFYTGEGRVLLYKHAGSSAPAEFQNDPLAQQLGWLSKALAFYHSPTGVFDMLVQFKDQKYARLLPNGAQFWYSPAGRLEAIYDRYTNNVHLLRYNERGELARIEDESVQTPRYLEIGYYRNPDELIPSGSEDVPTSNRHAVGRIARLVDYTEDNFPGRDVLFEYSEKGELEARRGIEVKTANPGGFLGRQQTRYTFGTSQNSAASPAQRAGDYPLANGLSGIIGGDPNGGALLAVSEFVPGAPVPVAKKFEGANGPVKLELLYENTAAGLAAGNGSLKVTTADDARSEMNLDKFGLPKDTMMSGSAAPPVTYKTRRDEFGLPKEIIYPLGNRVVFQYEPRSQNHRSKANVRRTETFPHGGGPPLTSSFNYEDKYNLQNGPHVDLNGNPVSYSLTPEGLDVGTISYPAVGVNLPSGAPPIPVGLGATEEFRFNLYGQLERHKDVNGVIQKSVFDQPDGFPSASVRGEATALTTTFTYEGLAGLLGLPRRSTPPVNAAAEFTYDEREQLLSRNRAGLLSTFFYDENGRVVRQTSTVDAGVELEALYSYLHNGFLRTNIMRFIEVGPQQALQELKVEYEPDAMFRVQRVKYPNGEQKVIAPIDHLGRPRAVTFGAYTESYTYDDNNNLLTVTKGDATTQYFYDGHDRLATILVPVGGNTQETETRSYFNSGAVREITTSDAGNNLNRRTTFQIDALNRTVATTTDTGGNPATAQVSWDGNTRTYKMASPAGEVSAIHYDDAGRAMTSSNSVRTLTFTRDANNNLERTVSSEGPNLARQFTTTHTPFDLLDRSTRTIDDEGVTAEFELRRLDGQVLKLRDGRGKTHLFDYTRLGEPKLRASPTGVEFRSAYDLNRQPKLAGDREDRGWTYEYDDTLRVTEHRLRDNQAFTFSQFDSRNQPQAINFPDLDIDLLYDLQARLTNQVVTYNAHTRSERASWDALDRITARSFNASFGSRSVSGTAIYDYHLLGPLRQSTTSINPGTGQNSFVLRYDVRLDGLRTNVVYPSAQVVAETRDLSGRLLTLQPQAAEPVVNATTYEGADIIGTQTFGPNSLVCENHFDGRKRLLRRTYSRPADGKVLAEVRYAYDANDNVIARQSVHRAGRADFFSYDDDDRLSRADLGARPAIAGAAARSVAGFAVPAELNAAPTAWAPGYFSRDYLYDNGAKLDRLTNSTPANPDSLLLPPFASSIGGFDQSLHPGMVDGVARGRDSLANTTNTVLQVRIPGSDAPVAVAAMLQYDGRGRLIRINRADEVVIDYEYLPSGLCCYRKVAGPGNQCVPSQRIFVWDGPRLIEEYDLSDVGKTLRARYFYTDSEVPVAADLRVGDGLQRFYFLMDIQGSLLGTADAQGNLVERYFYDAWGQPEIEPVDAQAPVVRRVVSAADGLLIEFSERVLPALLPPSNPGANQLVTTLVRLSDRMRVEQSGASIAGSFILEESRPGFAFGTVIRFQPSNALSGALVLRLQAGAVSDEWNNPLAAADIPLQFNAAPGANLFTNLAVTSTPRSSRTVSDQPFLFHGQYFDYDAGLVYLRARFYDPFTGLFLQPDPAGYEDSVNLYAAFSHNPQSMRDPSGTVVINAALAVGGAIIGSSLKVYHEGMSNPDATFRDFLGAGLSGAFEGALAGATLGASMVAEGIVLGVVGGVGGSLIDAGVSEGRIATLGEVAEAGAVGAAWGAGGAVAGKLVLGAGGRVLSPITRWGGSKLIGSRGRLGPAALNTVDGTIGQSANASVVRASGNASPMVGNVTRRQMQVMAEQGRKRIQELEEFRAFREEVGDLRIVEADLGTLQYHPSQGVGGAKGSQILRNEFESLGPNQFSRRQISTVTLNENLRSFPIDRRLTLLHELDHAAQAFETGGQNRGGWHAFIEEFSVHMNEVRMEVALRGVDATVKSPIRRVFERGGQRGVADHLFSIPSYRRMFGASSYDELARMWR